MSYHTKVESKLSEVGPFPPGYWFLQINTERTWLPGLPQGFFALMFKDDVTQAEAERFEKLFDHMVETLSFTPSTPDFPAPRGVTAGSSG